MAKKRAIHLHSDSNELSRLLTKHRLERAGVKLGSPAVADPDLEALLSRVRSATHRRAAKAPAVPPDIVRKLASG